MISLLVEPLLLFLLGAVVLILQGSAERTIVPAKLQELMQRDSLVTILDVRTDAEFNGPLGHIQGARLIPVHELEERLEELEAARATTIVVVCRSGIRSGRATTMLRSHGFEALNMVGGMIRWNAEGRPVTAQGNP